MSLEAIREYKKRRDADNKSRARSKTAARERFVQTFTGPNANRGGIPMERSQPLDRREAAMANRKGLLGGSSGGGKGPLNFSGLNDAIKNLGDIVTGAQRMSEANRNAQVAGMSASDPVMANLSPVEAHMLALPDRDAYMSPYDDAESAARDAYEAGKAVIGSSTEELKGDLSKNQQDYLAMQEAHRQQMMADQRMAGGQLRADLAPTGLAKDLGMAGDLAAEAGLINAMAGQASVAQQNLFNRMAEVQGQDYDARQQGAQGAEAAAQMAASQNLTALLGRIGMGRAEAEGQYNADVEQVKAANAESERRAREEYQRQVEQEQQALQKWESSQQQAAQKARISMYQKKEADYMQKFPIATSAFEGLLKDAGTEPTAANKQRALRLLPEMIAWAKQDRGVNLNESVLKRWISEHYDQQTIDENRFYENGGTREWLEGIR